MDENKLKKPLSEWVSNLHITFRTFVNPPISPYHPLRLSLGGFLYSIANFDLALDFKQVRYVMGSLTIYREKIEIVIGPVVWTCTLKGECRGLHWGCYYLEFFLTVRTNRRPEPPLFRVSRRVSRRVSLHPSLSRAFFPVLPSVPGEAGLPVSKMPKLSAFLLWSSQL